jgi:hypothetical protein
MDAEMLRDCHAFEDLRRKVAAARRASVSHDGRARRNDAKHDFPLANARLNELANKVAAATPVTDIGLKKKAAVAQGMEWHNLAQRAEPQPPVERKSTHRQLLMEVIRDSYWLTLRTGSDPELSGWCRL